MTIHLDDLAAQVRVALEEAEHRLLKLLAERKAISQAIKDCRVDLERLRKLTKAMTPKDQNGPHE